MKATLAATTLLSALVALAGCGGPDTQGADDAITYCPLSVAGLYCGEDPAPTPVRCTYTYSAWSACTGTGVQTRTVISKSPSYCTTGTPVTSQACTSYDVGVIPGSTGTCPGEVWMYLDDEDDATSNERGYVYQDVNGTWSLRYSDYQGWIGATVQNINTTFRVCRVDGTQFKPLTTTPSPSQEYMVFKLGTTCPNGSIEVIRRHDTEDSNNTNNSGGDIAPNRWDRDYYYLHYCLFRYGPSIMGTDNPDGSFSAGFPALGFSYGVISPMDFLFALNKGYIKIDDQNYSGGFNASPNDNGYDVLDPYAWESAQRMIWGLHDTWMVFSQVNYQ